MNRVRVLVFCLLLMSLILSPAQALAQAQVFPTSATISETLVFFNDCTGEDVVVQATTKIYILEVTNSSGGLNIKYHITTSGKATGVTSGAKYKFQSKTQSDQTLNGASTVNLAVRVQFIGQGKVPNTTSTLLIHFTTNANGEFTSLTEQFDDNCG